MSNTNDPNAPPPASGTIADWNASANFSSPYSEKIQRLHTLFDAARINGVGNYFYVSINKSNNLLPITQWDLPETTKDFQNHLNKEIPKQNYRVIITMDLRETFDGQIRSTGINPEQPVSWELLRRHPINCLDKTLLLEHKKPVGSLTSHYQTMNPKNIFNISTRPKTLALIEYTPIRFVINNGDIKRSTERGALLPIPDHF